MNRQPIDDFWALRALLLALSERDYLFTTPTWRATRLRRSGRPITSLTDIFGWNRAFKTRDLERELLASMRVAGMMRRLPLEYCQCGRFVRGLSISSRNAIRRYKQDNTDALAIADALVQRGSLSSLCRVDITESDGRLELSIADLPGELDPDRRHLFRHRRPSHRADCKRRAEAGWRMAVSGP